MTNQTRTEPLDRLVNEAWIDLRNDTARSGGMPHVIDRHRPLIEAAIRSAEAREAARLRDVVEFVADWAHDCSSSNRSAPWERQTVDEIDPAAYGFDDIEERCRAALVKP